MQRLLGLLLLAMASAASAAPLPTRDQNPLLAGFGLPMPLPARTPQDDWSFTADFNWGSSALIQRSSEEFLVVDAETRELRLTVDRRLGERWTIGLQLPYRYIGGGNLDSFIDTWHEVFGLPEGPRPQQPKDRMRVHYSRGDAEFLEIGTDTSGLADASFTLGYQLLDVPAAAMRAGLFVKAPTGEDDLLNSSGAIDVSAVIAGARKVGERVSLFGQASVTWLGEGELLPAQQRDLIWSGQAGMDWHLTRGLELTVQLDAHTRMFDETELDFFGDALILTAGGTYRFDGGWALNIAVSEDIEVERSPDVVFIIGVRRGMRR